MHTEVILFFTSTFIFNICVQVYMKIMYVHLLIEKRNYIINRKLSQGTSVRGKINQQSL